MKKDQYFSLEVNLLNDDNIISMLGDLNTLESFGAYVVVLMHLRTKDNYEASCQPGTLKEFARRYNVKLEMLQRIIHDFNLFVVDKERQTFRAPYMDRVMKKLEDRFKANAENGKKGGRPKKETDTPETPASKGQKPNQNQEKRGEDKRCIPTVEYNSSNTPAKKSADAADDEVDGISSGQEVATNEDAEKAVSAGKAVRAVGKAEHPAVGKSARAGKSAPTGKLTPAEKSAPADKAARAEKSASAGKATSAGKSAPAAKPAPARSGMTIRQAWDEGQLPLQPVRPWEELVDELGSSQIYMELIGQRSGLGELFINYQALILKYFKEHVTLYGKGSELLFPDDVRRYFSNFISAGSITCQKLRDRLLSELKTSNGRNINRFEDFTDGKRTYMGHLIPDNAPARPDANAVWDTVLHRWGH